MSQNLGLNFTAGAPSSTGPDIIIQASCVHKTGLLRLFFQAIFLYTVLSDLNDHTV